MQSLNVAVRVVRPGRERTFGLAVRDSVRARGCSVARGVGVDDVLGLAEGDGAGRLASQLPLPVPPPLQVALHVPVATPSPDELTDTCPVLRYSHEYPLTVALPTTIEMSDPDTVPLPDPGCVTVTFESDIENATVPE